MWKKKREKVRREEKKKEKTSTKIETKFAAFGIRLDAEPMMKTTLFAFFPERTRQRHAMHPGYDADIPET